jgi:phosphoserine phosphatase RsbU/P
VLAVADVAGKGIGASLLTASFEALAAGPLEDGQPPEEICRLVASRLHRRTPPEKYVTAFLAVVEPASGRMRWANAGHNPALLLRAGGEVEVLEATGVPLGLLPAVTYAGRDTVLAPGDALLVYTDGVTEATDESDEEYGLQRLIARCRELRGRAPVALVAGVQDEVASFADAPPFQDDLTLLAVRREEPGA